MLQALLAKKSHLLSTITHLLNKSLSYHSGYVEKDGVLMLTPTGIATVNADGAAINSVFSIHPDRNYVKSISKLNDKKHSFLGNIFRTINENH